MFLDATGSLQIDLGDQGLLDFRFGAGEIALLAYDGRDRLFGDHPLAAMGLCAFVYEKNDRGVLFVQEYEREVYWYSKADRAFSCVTTLARDEDWLRECWNAEIVPWNDERTESALALICYESGLVGITEAGGVAWEVVGELGRHSLVGFRPGRAMFEDETTGARWMYDLATGRRIE